MGETPWPRPGPASPPGGCLCLSKEFLFFSTPFGQPSYSSTSQGRAVKGLARPRLRRLRDGAVRGLPRHAPEVLCPLPPAPGAAAPAGTGRLGDWLLLVRQFPLELLHE